MKKRNMFLLTMLTAGSMAFTRQPGKQPKNNQSENPDFKFKVVKELGNTSIKIRDPQEPVGATQETLSLNLK